MAAGQPRVCAWLVVVRLLVVGFLLGVLFSAPVAAQTPTPVPAPAPTAAPAPAVIAQPVVVVGYGQGARGVEFAILAVLVFGLFFLWVTLFYGVFVRRR